MFTIGFTGTKHGMTGTQFHVVRGLVLAANVFHAAEIRGVHTDRLGADVQFHEICIYAGASIVIRPPMIDSWRAWLGTEKAVKLGDEFDGIAQIEKIHDPDDPFCSNRRMMAASDVLIAAPVSEERGTTWQTIRQARRIKPQKPMFIVSPVGQVTVEHWSWLDQSAEWKWWELPDVEVTYDPTYR